MIRIEILGRPRGKQDARKTRTGTVYVPEMTRNEMATLRLLGSTAMKGRPPTPHACKVNIVAIMPIPPSWGKKRQQAALAGEVHATVKPDHDNIAKMLDGLSKIVWVDDKQVTESAFRKCYGDRPGVFLEISDLEGNDI